MYHGGPQSFFEDWREFTSTPTPQRVQRDPRLVLVARSFDGRTRQALEFLVQRGLPVPVQVLHPRENDETRTMRQM